MFLTFLTSKFSRSIFKFFVPLSHIQYIMTTAWTQCEKHLQPVFRVTFLMSIFNFVFPSFNNCFYRPVCDPMINYMQFYKVDIFRDSPDTKNRKATRWIERLFFIYGIKMKTSNHNPRRHALRSAGSAQIHARGAVSENRRSNSENNKPVFKENYAN